VVLVNIAGPHGDKSAPLVTAPANSHADTVSTDGHRTPAAAAADNTALAASANTEPVASIGGGSGVQIPGQDCERGPDRLSQRGEATQPSPHR
jgi:hypothetical protein